MAAILSGIVYNDLNNNGQHDTGEPGIPGVYVVVSWSSGWMKTLTDGSGNYSFSVDGAGPYTIYETIADPVDVYPPPVITQPDGFSASNGPRVLTVNVSNVDGVSENNNFSHVATGAEIPCEPVMIQFYGTSTETTWANVNLVTGESNDYVTLNISSNVNSIGYYQGYIYGTANGKLVRVDNNGNVTYLPTTQNFVTVSGVVDTKGYFYSANVNAGSYYTVDVNPNSPTYLKLINPATGLTTTQPTTLTPYLSPADWGYNVNDGNLYVFTDGGLVYRIDPSTGEGTQLTTSFDTNTPIPTGIGAVIVDSIGNLYGIENSTGAVYKLTITGDTATGIIFAQAKPASGNDGAMCLEAAIEVDFGDAPDLGAGNAAGNYNTLLANNGPRHQIVSPLFIGTEITAEDDAKQNPGATGDEDDGIVTPLPLIPPRGGDYTVTVTATNNTDFPANLYGWVDFNRNGLFETTESATVIVPANSGTKPYTLAFTVTANTAAAGLNTFARFRLTTDELDFGTITDGQDAASVGPASDGEVEDYIAAYDLLKATISGFVYNDLNNNNTFDAGEEGIPGAYVVLYSDTDGCVSVQTDASGYYSFDVTPGDYTVYETVSEPDACPPTVFTQPDGFSASNGYRVLEVSITDVNVNSENNNFGHVATGTEIPCDSTMIVFANGTDGITHWFNVNLVTGKSVDMGTLNPVDNVNAIGYYDGYIYGADATARSLVRIDINGNITQLPTLPGITFPAGYVSGTIDKNGYYYLYDATSRYYVVDLNTNSATYLQLVDPTNGYLPTSGSLPMNPYNYVADWAINPEDGMLYGVNYQDSTVYRLDPITGISTMIPTSYIGYTPTSADSIGGGAVFDINGNMYVVANISGEIYKFTISEDTATGIVFTQSVSVRNADATMCYFAQIEVDFGDAPDLGAGSAAGNYNSLLANNGPRHQIVSPLFIGTAVTAEDDTIPSPDATGDEDDGIAAPLPEIPASGGDYTVTVTATNNTDAPANLYGWVDFNRNGLFETTESAMVTVPANSGTQPYTLTFTAPDDITAAGNDTFARFRLTTDELDFGLDTDSQDAASIGPASDGEVEDYIVAISVQADLSLTKEADLTVVSPGNEVTYTLKVTNNGPNTAAAPVVTDGVSANLTNPQYSLDGTAWSAWTGSYTFGDMASGDTEQILIKGIVSDTAVLPLTNTAELESPTYDPDKTNNTGTVTIPAASADLSMEKTADMQSVTRGDTVTYTLKVTNSGPDTAVAPVITDEISADITDPQYSVDNGATWSAWTGSYTLENMAAGAVEQILIKGTVSETTVPQIENTARITSPTPDPDESNNTNIVIINFADNTADLSMVKTASPNPAKPGDIITFTLTVKNSGPMTAESPVVTDTVSAAVESPQFSIDGGTTWNPWTGSVTLASIPANGTAQILIQGTVAQNAKWPLTNVSGITSATSDPDPSNNTSFVRVGGPRCRAAIDVVESVALQEAALSHILNAEGEKMQKMIAAEGVTYCDLMKLNKKVRNLVNAATRLEMIMQGKLELLDGSCCDDC